MTTWILMIAFPGALSQVGAVDLHRDLTREQCVAMADDLGQADRRSLAVACYGPNGETYEPDR